MAEDYEPLTTTEMLEELDTKKMAGEVMINQMAGQDIQRPKELYILPAESDKVAALLEALVKASTEFEPIKQSGLNTVPYRYTYATLDDIRIATEPALSKYGLRIVHQELPLDRDYWILATKLRHSTSGEWIASYAPIDPEPEAGTAFSSKQEWGKACSYTKKYQIALMLNLSSETDRDGRPGSEDAKDREPPGARKAEKAPGKRKQSPAEVKSWAILNELGIDQAAWKEDIYEKYSIKSMTELEPKTWSKIVNALEKYQEFILLICDHWQCVSKELRQFLVYKFAHKIGESYDVLHEALNTENGKMAELFKAFDAWKEMPEEDSEAEPDEEVESEAHEPAGESEASEPPEEEQLFAQIRETLEAAGHDATYIEKRMEGLKPQKAAALRKILATEKQRLKNGNGKKDDLLQ